MCGIEAKTIWSRVSEAGGNEKVMIEGRVVVLMWWEWLTRKSQVSGKIPVRIMIPSLCLALPLPLYLAVKML